MDHADHAALAAGQLSQADIIERQAESIARLQRQVRKGSEYKQLTKSKLKEAAARLKEYRLKVEELQQEAAQAQQALKQEQEQHAKTKSRDRRKRTREVAVQTQAEQRRSVARQTQTQLSGDVESRRTSRAVDCAVQTEKEEEKEVVVAAAAASRKRSRDERGQSDGDQLVPKLSRAMEVGDGATMSEAGKPQLQPLQMETLGLKAVAFPHETSAALDAALAFSDSEDDADKVQSEAVPLAGKENYGDTTVSSLLDPEVSNEIDKELESDGEQEIDAEPLLPVTGKDSDRTKTVLPLLDPDVVNDIDKELESSSDEEEDRGGAVNCVVQPKQGDAAPKVSLDPDVANDIDKELESTSDEEKDSRDAVNCVVQRKQVDAASNTSMNTADPSRKKRILKSIDDELDDEFAALDSDPEVEHQSEKHAIEEKNDENSSSSSDSSDSDSSDSSDSDSEGAEANATTKNQRTELTDEGVVADQRNSQPANDRLVSSAVVDITSTRCAELPTGAAKTTTAPQSTARIDTSGVPSSLPNQEAVVLTTSLLKKPVTRLSGNGEAPSGDVDLPSQSLVPHQRSISAVTGSRKYSKEYSSAAEDFQTSSIKKQVSVADHLVETPSMNISVSTSESLLSHTKAPLREVSLLGSTEKSATVILADKQTEETELELDVRNNQPSIPLSAKPALVKSKCPAGSHTPPKENVSEDLTQIISVGKARKVDEAVLENADRTPRKKVKLDEKAVRVENGEIIPPVNAVADKDMTKEPHDLAAAEDNDKVHLKKSLVAFKRGITLGKSELKDNNYTRRTFGSLAKHSARFLDSHRDHVLKLCQTLADTYRKMKVSPIVVIRGALGIFRASRSRRSMSRNESLGLSWLAYEVLINMMSESTQPCQEEVSNILASFWFTSLNECLLHLRGLLVGGRTDIGGSLSDCKTQLHIVKEQNVISHDNSFLAEICALHTRLCQASGRLVWSRVLLYDLVRENPNMRGLYFAMIVLEINPAIMEREFDQKCDAREVLLKETLLQALVVITGIAGAKQKVLLHQSSGSMLHRISDAIQMPELIDADGDSISFQEAFIGKLFAKLREACRLPHEQMDGVAVSSDTSDRFELSKSLELYTAVYGLDLVAQCFSIERCKTLFGSANISGKNKVVDAVGHISIAAAAEKGKKYEPNSQSEQYIESVIDWLCHLLVAHSIGETTADDLLKLQLRCATVCVELILEYSSEAGLSTRRQALFAVTSWFEASPSERLMDLPAAFLRRLRLAVIAARPQVVPQQV